MSVDGPLSDTDAAEQARVSYISDGNFFLLKFSKFDLENAVVARELMQAHPSGRTAVGRLCDLREALYDADPGEIRKLVADRARHNETNGTRPCAIVVSSDYSFGMNRIYQALMDGADENVLVTKDYDAAIEWLKARGVS